MEKPEKAKQETKDSSPAVERWIEEFKKLTPEQQREVCHRFFTEVLPPKERKR